MKPKGVAIDITPTWAGLLPYFFLALEAGNAEGRKVAREELRRMAQAADRWNANAGPMLDALKMLAKDLCLDKGPCDPESTAGIIRAVIAKAEAKWGVQVRRSERGRKRGKKP